MSSAYSIDIGNSKNKFLDASRSQPRHRELQKQASRCPPVTAPTPGIPKTSFSMSSAYSIDIGNSKNKFLDALRSQPRHREFQKQASRCPPSSAQSSEILKTSFPMPSAYSTDTGNSKNKLLDACHLQHRHRKFQKQASRCPTVTAQAQEISKTSFPMPHDYNKVTTPAPKFQIIRIIRISIQPIKK